jgi:GTP-binding protein
MKIKTVQFIKSAIAKDPIFSDGHPQIALIGRSNVGKSSLINSLLGQTAWARVSAAPGRTRLLNIFLINEAFYLVDLPGYGYAKVSHAERADLYKLINWYLFLSDIKQHQVVLIIDANIGPTTDDLEILESLERYDKNVLVVANKVDKIKPSLYKPRLQEISEAVSPHKIIPYSTVKKIGIADLWQALNL